MWDVLSSILEKNKVQLICPTHHIQANIRKYFPKLFILTTEASASGRERIGIKVSSKDETLNITTRQQRTGQITFDV
jgi:hypothetical protein